MLYNSVINPIADGGGIWETLARTLEEQLANCLSSISWSTCLVIQTFLILHLLRNDGSINSITLFFMANYFSRSILASLRVLNLYISKVSLSWTIFFFKKKIVWFSFLFRVTAKKQYIFKKPRLAESPEALSASSYQISQSKEKWKERRMSCFLRPTLKERGQSTEHLSS